MSTKKHTKTFLDFCGNSPNLSDSLQEFITLMWNTDGMQIFSSNTFSLWPFYLVVNELPPKKRFLSENLLIAGVWGSVVKPHPNVFLLPIYKDLKTIEKGINIVED